MWPLPSSVIGKGRNGNFIKQLTENEIKAKHCEISSTPKINEKYYESSCIVRRAVKTISFNEPDFVVTFFIAIYFPPESYRCRVLCISLALLLSSNFPFMCSCFLRAFWDHQHSSLSLSKPRVCMSRANNVICFLRRQAAYTHSRPRAEHIDTIRCCAAETDLCDRRKINHIVILHAETTTRYFEFLRS